MGKKHFRLQHSESVVVHAASRIYAAYIASGRVADGEESRWMERSIREAMSITQAVDDSIISDEEIDANEREDARPEDLAAGCDVLIASMLARAGVV